MAFPVMMIPAALQAGMGIYQMTQSKANIDRPQYEIPESLKKAVATQRRAASQSEIPGYDRAMEQIQGGTASSISAMAEASDSGAGMLGAIAQLADTESERVKDLNVASAQYLTAEKDKYLNTLGQMAQQEQAAWQWDTQQPYLDEAARASAMFQSGMTNIMGGVSSAAGAMYEQQTNKQMMDIYKGLLGDEGSKVASINDVAKTVNTPEMQRNAAIMDMAGMNPNNEVKSPQYQNKPYWETGLFNDPLISLNI